MDSEASGPGGPEHGEGAGPGAGPDQAGRPRPGGRARRAVIAAVVVVVLGLVGTVVWIVSSNDDPEPVDEASVESTTTTSTTAAPADQIEVPGSSLVATSQVPEIQAFATPEDGAEVVTSLSNTTDFGLPRTFLVKQQQAGWLEVLLPIRPNGASGWVREADVTVATTTYAVAIELEAHKVTMYDGGEPILEADAVIGEPDTPTPVGTFYVTDPVDLQDEPNGPYGAFALGLSGFSEVLTEFAGGPGQIALHGTNRPDQVGQDISNGCVRVPNEAILQIAQQLPLGTPVLIA